MNTVSTHDTFDLRPVPFNNSMKKCPGDWVYHELDVWSLGMVVARYWDRYIDADNGMVARAMTMVLWSRVPRNVA
jgi:hypothetical protein